MRSRMLAMAVLTLGVARLGAQAPPVSAAPAAPPAQVAPTGPAADEVCAKAGLAKISDRLK